MYKLAVFLTVIIELLRESAPYNLTVYKTVDGELETIISGDKIELKDDVFHLLVVNQSIPKLHEECVLIKNELSILQILNCTLTDIDPGAFQIVPTLTLLRISLNLITTVKRGVFNSIKVKEIDLSRNFISAIEDEAFDNNTNLEILKLNHNAIKEISPNWFQNSPNVYKISAIYNELTSIDANSFRNLAKGRHLKLRLSANRIREIHKDAFAGVGDIDVLRLNGNKLTTLPEELFINRTVRVLQINTNRLICFPDSMFRSSVESLWFLENPTTTCACLRKVKEFVDANGVDVMYPAVICEDKEKEINLVFNFNKTYEIPLLAPTFK